MTPYVERLRALQQIVAAQEKRLAEARDAESPDREGRRKADGKLASGLVNLFTDTVPGTLTAECDGPNAHGLWTVKISAGGAWVATVYIEPTDERDAHVSVDSAAGGDPLRVENIKYSAYERTWEDALANVVPEIASAVGRWMAKREESAAQ